MKRCLLIMLSAALCVCARGEQPRSVSADFDFVEYLIGARMARDASVYLEGIDFAPSDTLDYLRGLALYNARELGRAADCFSRVPEGSRFYDKSLFLAAVSNVYEKDYARGAGLLNSYGGPYGELRDYQLAGIALLQDDEQAYRRAARTFSFDSYALADGERLFEDISSSRFAPGGRSPFAAAAMSAVVPGLGKIYAGRLDEGLAAFITVGTLAAITAENWVKCGPSNWKTILFGTLGTIFHIGNIYGSYVSVGITDNQTRDAQNAAIVYNLHLSVRSVFQ